MCAFSKSSTNDSSVQPEPMNRSHDVNAQMGIHEVEATLATCILSPSPTCLLIIFVPANTFHVALLGCQELKGLNQTSAIEI